MLRTVSGLVVAVALASCSGPSPSESSKREEGAAGPAFTPVETEAAAPMLDEAPDGFNRTLVQPGPGGGTPGVTGPLMAYRYTWSFSVPTENMARLQAAHQKLCQDAGPGECYVTSSSLNAIGKAEGAAGSLSMRASEAWVRRFEAGVTDGLKPYGGSIYANGKTSEELTTQIVDNEARLRSMIAHRDALQKMVDNKPGKLADLLEIEKALADTQGDIDSRQSLLAALKLRVAMSELTFSYQPEYAAVSNSIWRPIRDAFGDFGPAFAGTVAAGVRFVAAALPVVLLVVMGWLAVVAFRRRRRPIRPVVNPGRPDVAPPG